MEKKKSQDLIHIHIYTTFIFSFRNPKTHAKRRIHRPFTSYRAKVCLYLIPTVELKFCPLSLFRGNVLFFFFNSVIKWQIPKSSSHISQWFFPQLPQAMITSHDFKTSFIFTKSTLITSAPQTTWRPTVLVVWLASFVLLRVSLLMWPRPSEVFWWMYIHPRLPGLLPMNSSQGVTPPAYTFSLHVEFFFSHQVCPPRLWPCGL